MRHLKWSILIFYSIFVLLMWPHRKLLYQYISFFAETPFGEFPLNALLVVILLLGFIALIRLLKSPGIRKRRVRNIFLRAGLQNSVGEVPELISVYADKKTQHGKIFVIANKGVSIVDIDAKIPRLETGLNGRIYRLEFGKKTSTTLLYLLPRKYDSPTVISADSKHLCESPNFLVVGATGSGKSYALLVLLQIYATHIRDVSITICDYKKSSFAHFADTPNFYGYEDVPNGIRAIYREFSERLAANDVERNKKICVLLIDEYGAMITAQDKKTADELKMMVANMLFMGRSLGIRILIGVQRSDSEHFKAGARDQFKSILALSNLSKEQKQMLFSDYKDRMSDHNGLGEGYLLVDGQGLSRVKVAEIQDMGALNESIRKALCR